MGRRAWWCWPESCCGRRRNWCESFWFVFLLSRPRQEGGPFLGTSGPFFVSFGPFFFFFFCLLLLPFFTRLLPAVCCRFLPLEFFHPALFFGEPERAKEEAKRETKPDGKLSLTPFPPFKKNKKRLKNVSNFFSSFKQIAAKVHPMTIIAGFRAAAAVAEASLSSGAIDHAKESPASFRDSLLRVARTTLSSKILTNDRDHFAELAVSAVLRLQRPEDGVSPPALDAVHVLKKAGGALADSFLDEGFILDKAIGVGQPRRVENAKILVANTAMDTDKVKIYGARVRVDSMAKVAELEAAERDKMREKVRRKLFFFSKSGKIRALQSGHDFCFNPPPKKKTKSKINEILSTGRQNRRARSERLCQPAADLQLPRGAVRGRRGPGGRARRFRRDRGKR